MVTFLNQGITYFHKEGKTGPDQQVKQIKTFVQMSSGTSPIIKIDVFKYMKFAILFCNRLKNCT